MESASISYTVTAGEGEAVRTVGTFKLEPERVPESVRLFALRRMLGIAVGTEASSVAISKAKAVIAKLHSIKAGDVTKTHLEQWRNENVAEFDAWHVDAANKRIAAMYDGSYGAGERGGEPAMTPLARKVRMLAERLVRDRLAGYKIPRKYDDPIKNRDGRMLTVNGQPATMNGLIERAIVKGEQDLEKEAQRELDAEARRVSNLRKAESQYDLFDEPEQSEQPEPIAAE